LRSPAAVDPTQEATFDREREAYRNGARLVAGLDEAGRGPLAGPVVAAAVILNPRSIPSGIADSKVLAAEARERLFDALLATTRAGIGIASAAEIDRINIRRATFLAMNRALVALGTRPCLALVDGSDCPSLPCPATAIVDGDAQILSVAAASIVAKVTRDRLMCRLCLRYPGYGFSEHKGYATPAHRAALAALGPCPEHRLSFATVRTCGIYFET
jgi:ribonuclease HII